jgi:tetratricopeptide (TPR) repeat protein/transcriptional regulator with XRE-family HTH domain
MTMDEMARFLGYSEKTLISAYERGRKVLSREQLDAIAAALGHPPEAVDVFLFAHDLIHPEPHEAPISPIALSPDEVRTVHRIAMAAGWTAGQVASEIVRAERVRSWKEGKKASEFQQTEEFYKGLMALTPKERRTIVSVYSKLWSWALAVRVCEASVKRAAHKAEEALELAELALSIAERVPGEESWLSRLKGYCWAHVANARRVGNDLAGADEAFARAWDLWRAGTNSAPEPLAEWRLYDLEASLRRAERRFSEALTLLDRARDTCGGDPVTVGRILLNREHVADQMGDIRSALATLAEATVLLRASDDPRLLFILHFKKANHLCHLERYEEAAKLLPQVRELAIQQGNELDLIRVSWLTAKVAAGNGRVEEGSAGLEQVSRDFTTRELPYDAALSSLDLAVLWLKAGRTAEVRELAVAMRWIFKAQGIAREALAALKVFYDAACQEAATVGLAQQVITVIEKARMGEALVLMLD